MRKLGSFLRIIFVSKKESLSILYFDFVAWRRTAYSGSAFDPVKTEDVRPTVLNHKSTQFQVRNLPIVSRVKSFGLQRRLCSFSLWLLSAQLNGTAVKSAKTHPPKAPNVWCGTLLLAAAWYVDSASGPPSRRSSGLRHPTVVESWVEIEILSWEA